MYLEYVNGIMIFNCGFADRDIPKQAGFTFHGEKNTCYRKDCRPCRVVGGTNCWFTDDIHTAKKLYEYANEPCKEIIDLWLGDLDKKAKESFKQTSELDLLAPEGLEYFGYQKAGIEFLMSNKNVLLADEMGLGKTIQAIGLMNNAEGISKTLIICPSNLKINWQREVNKWLIGSKFRRINIATTDHYPSFSDVVIINYDILHKYESELRARVWDLVIVDEAHYVKTKTARRSKQVYGFKKKVKGKTVTVPPIRANRKLLMTGTPIDNKPEDVFCLVHFLDNTIFRNEWEFMNTYYDFEDVSYYVRGGGGERKTSKKKTEPKNLEALNQILRTSVMMRRMKKDVLQDLPAKIYKITEIEGGADQPLIDAEIEIFTKWEDLKKEREKLESGDKDFFAEQIRKLKKSEGEAFEEMARIRQELGIRKIPHVIPMIEETLGAKPKLIVFAYHRAVIEAITKAFPSSMKIYGGMKELDRQESIDQFQNNPNVNLIVCSLANAEGYTLTASSDIMTVEYDWRPSKMAQSEDRAHRIGQEKHLMINYVFFQNSIDVKMSQRVEEKKVMINEAIN